MIKVAVAIITYHPNLNLLRKNIERYIDVVDKILIWENSSNDFEIPQEWGKKVEKIGLKQNQMMAYPLNQIVSRCKEDGYDYLMTMDQDSLWNNFGAFLMAAEKIFTEDNAVAICAPSINWDGIVRNPGVIDIEWVIQSGMLFSLKTIKGLDGFREDYGIYGVDEEYCFYLRLNGLKVKKLLNFNLTQQYGKAEKSRWGYTFYNYSPFVRFLMIRNMVWMKREFPSSVSLRRIVSTYLHNMRDILVSEKGKFQKSLALTKGLWSGLFCKFTHRDLTPEAKALNR